jgi:biopolymer transport protein ExbB
MPNRAHAPYTGLALLAAFLLTTASFAATADSGASPDKAEKGSGDKRVSVADFILAGGIVGHVIIVLSFVGLALVIDTAIYVQVRKLVPPRLTEELVNLAGQGRFAEISNLCRSLDCMLARIVDHTFSQGRMSWAAAREVMQEQGTKEVTRLHQRVGYIGFIASVAPMLGLLGTVTGMIRSFNVLGTARGAAKPEDLAVGVAEALVTTCEGLIVALPLMFFYSYFKDRVTRVGQEAAGACDRLMRTMTEAHAALSRAQPAARKETLIDEDVLGMTEDPSGPLGPEGQGPP